ncbi:hypothetical protein [Pseudomonas putida]|uniref:hypothetical protein n=1 Tax=Pseudomonas putida TaxID=303 RepID=UPI00381E7D0B
MNYLSVLATFCFVLSGTAQAETISMPVEVIDVRPEQSTPSKWVRYEGLSSEKVAHVVKEAGKQGADCHEFKGGLLVCRYPGDEPKSVGVDWIKLQGDGLKEALDGL